MTDNPQQLKPCPFCSMEIQRFSGLVRCPEHTEWLTPEAWNTRILDDSTRRKLELLDKYVFSLGCQSVIRPFEERLINEYNSLTQPEQKGKND